MECTYIISQKLHSGIRLNQLQNVRTITHRVRDLSTTYVQWNFSSRNLFKWKTSLVLIPGNKTVRPISLMSCVCKLMEWILYHRISWFIESRPILPEAQAGFRPFRACDDNLVTLITAVRSGFLNQSITIAVFLDIVSIFDNVDPFS